MSGPVLCVQREGTAAEHCWHQTMMARMTNPPKQREQCCHCGDYRYIVVSRAIVTDHGPFLRSAVADAGPSHGHPTPAGHPDTETG